MQRILAIVALFYVSESRFIVDLTHTFDKDATKYPLGLVGVNNLTYFDHWVLSAGYSDSNDTDHKMWVAIKYLEFYEHMGTHIDAPFHFAEKGQKLHEIPPERLIGPGVVIDVQEKAITNPNYAVTVADIQEYENTYGRIPRGAIVIMNSGWDKKYPNPEAVFGTINTNDPSTFNFPGWHIDACRFLLAERQVGVVGVDTPSADPAKPTSDPYGFTYPCHMYLQPAEVPLLEYVANLDAVPRKGTTMFLGAIKSRDGTGGPTRIFAIIETDPSGDTTSAASCRVSIFISGLYLCCVSLYFRFV